MQRLRRVRLKLLIFCLLTVILSATGIVYAKEMIVEKNYNNKSEIPENITENENGIPLYSIERVGELYKVIFRNQTEEEIRRANEFIKCKPISYEKTVRKYFIKSFSSIPENMDYSEYNNEFDCMVNGKLDLISVSVFRKEYIAEYSGMLTNK